MKKYKRKPWTDTERKTLAENYLSIDIELMMHLLPERSQQAIRNQVSYLKKRGYRFKTRLNKG
jgi:hypothetical protein|tara:strand:- start:1993 stop:2181 length:189 start_codon:yes stop_codon:yes gene_type:complete